MSDTAVQHTPQPVKSLKIAQEAQSRLLVVGIVGAVGAGTSWTARVLQRLLEHRKVPASIIKARDGIAAAVGEKWDTALALRSTDPLTAASQLQELGDKLRADHDNAIVASAMISEIVRCQAEENPPKVMICDWSCRVFMPLLLLV